MSLFIWFQKMLDYLKDKKDVGFFLSVQALMQTCRYIVTGDLVSSAGDQQLLNVKYKYDVLYWCMFYKNKGFAQNKIALRIQH